LPCDLVILGPEWDSSDEEENEPAVVDDQNSSKKQGKDKKVSTTKKARNTDKGSNKRNHNDDDQKADKDSEKLVLYIGHLPKEFEEQDLQNFLSQFGKVYHCRVARKIETGKPKGYAFVRFADLEVAKIACETLHGYFLGRQRLVCQLRPPLPGMFFDTDKVISKRRHKLQLEKKRRGRNLANAEKLKEITSRLVAREQRKRKKLEALGIDFDFPGYKSNQAEFEVQFVPDTEGDVKDGHDTNEKEDSTKNRDSSRGKDSVHSEGGSAQKKRRKDSVDSAGSEKKSKKKESMDGQEKMNKDEESINREASATKSKRKDSMDSIRSDEKKSKKKRKESIDSEQGTNGNDADASYDRQETTPVKNVSDNKEHKLSKSEKKAKKKKDKKRRSSAP
jgi:nucleolar protein 15